MSCNLFRWNCARHVPLASGTKRFAPEVAPAIPGARVLVWRYGKDHLWFAGSMRLILSVSILPVVVTVGWATMAVCCVREQAEELCLGGIQFMRLDC